MRPTRRHLRTAAVTLVGLAAMAALTSPPAHAAHTTEGGLRWPTTTILVHDGTGSPVVGQAERAWTGTGVVSMAASVAPCTPGSACIEVTEASLPSPLAGWSHWAYDGAGHLTGCTVYIAEPAPRVLSLAEWQATVVHEMGHCLGLGHAAPGADSVMLPALTGRTAPTETDREVLADLYR